MTILLWTLTFLPALFFLALCVMYRAVVQGRQNEIRTIMGRGKTFKKYLAAFRSRPESDREADDDLEVTLRELFNKSYGSVRYIVPWGAISLVAGLSVLIFLVWANFPMIPPAPQQRLRDIPPESVAAIGGALLWGMYEALQRFQTIDLSPISIQYITLRMLLAPVVAALVGSGLAGSFKLVVAFGIGAFPVQAISDFIKGQARNKLNAGLAEPVEPPTLHYLQGMTPAMLQRLQNEGLEGAEHVAGADPFKLLLKTNLEWKVILDIVDQAILLDYIGDKIAKLRPLGIRGAIEFATIYESLTGDDNAVKQDAKRLVTAVAKILEQDEAGVINVAANLYEDVQVNLIWALWGDAAITPDAGKEAGPTDGNEAERAMSVDFDSLVNAVADQFQAAFHITVRPGARSELIDSAIPYQSRVDKDLAQGVVTQQGLEWFAFMILREARTVALAQGNDFLDRQSIIEAKKKERHHVMWS